MGKLSLSMPYPVYGEIIDSNGDPVVGATVYATDSTDPQGNGTCVTNASGQYQINLQTVATDGSTIRVWCSDGGEFKDTTFTLDIGDSAERIDLALAQGSNDFTIDSYLKAIQTNDFSIDSVLKATQAKDFLIDAILDAIKESDFSIDGFLKATQDSSFYLDSVLKAT